MKNGFIEIENSQGKEKLEIIDFIQSSFVGGRTITVAKLEDNTFGLSVENPQSSGRALQSSMRLTEESFLALLSSCMLYFNHNNIDLVEKLNKLINNKDISYTYSDNSISHE